jgi:predicted hotdog family 3-hydroxylacyl-ACP dehydratase
MSDFPDPAALLPHAAPMVLIDGIDARPDAQHIRCSLTVRSDMPFVRGGEVAAVVALEYLAQAAGLMMGLKALDNMGFVPEGGGRLISARSLELETATFEVGERLELALEWSGSVGNLEAFSGQVLRAGQCCARARFHVLRSAPLELE